MKGKATLAKCDDFYASIDHSGNIRMLPMVTKREAEVLDLLCAGLGDYEIGERLFISPLTVHDHVWNVQEKTGIHGKRGRLRLVLWWMDQRGWLTGEYSKF